MKLRPNFILALIIILTLSFRLYLAFSSQYFDSDTSYFNARVINNIIAEKAPFSYDQLSYSGREIIQPQLFHYLLSLFSFLPYFMKIIPEVFIASLTIVIYLIAKKITKDPLASLIAALLVSFSPALIASTSNQISVYSLAIPLFYLMILCLMDINSDKNLYIFIAISFLLPLIHPASFLFAFSMLFYLILAFSEPIEIEKKARESILFSFFLMLLINFIIFKKAFLSYGLNIIWQNIPPQLIVEHFGAPSVLNSLYLIGIIPLVLGSLGIFYGYFKQKDKNLAILTSTVLTIILLLLLRMIDLPTGLLFFSISLTLLSSIYISKIIKYIEITKIHKLKNALIILGICVIILIVIIPSFFSKTAIITPFEISNLESIKESSPEGATMMAPVSQGNIVTYFTNMKNVADSNFILAPNPEQRLKDIKTAYTTISESKALEIFHKYNVQYLFISKEAERTYGIKKPAYLENEICFKQRKSTVYEIKC